MATVRDTINIILASQKVGKTVELNDKALFKTKIADEMKYNGQIVDVIGFKKGKDIFCDRYIVRFNDGTINDNIMCSELNFDLTRVKNKNKNIER